MDEQTNQKIQELQILEQNLVNIVFQKQTFQVELSEIQQAIKEINDSKEDVFKIIGPIMVKTERKKIKQELEDKEKMFSLRIKAIDKQEKAIAEKSEILRQEILKKINQK